MTLIKSYEYVNCPDLTPFPAEEIEKSIIELVKFDYLVADAVKKNIYIMK